MLNTKKKLLVLILIIVVILLIISLGYFIQKKDNMNSSDIFNKSIEQILEESVSDLIKNEIMNLPTGYSILEFCVGDLNGDGLLDVAVIVEKGSGNCLGDRTLYLLLQDENGKYKISNSNNNLILGKEEGGIFGDPFESILIENNKLLVNHYGGSAFRWQFTFTFEYVSSQYLLTSLNRTDYYTGTANGTQAEYDFITNKLLVKSISLEDSKYEKIIYSKDIFSAIYIFDKVTADEICEMHWGEYLPWLNWYEYSKYDGIYRTEITANEALHMVYKRYGYQLEKSGIEWTEEAEKNYSSLIFYNVPEYYYKLDGQRLYYANLEFPFSEEVVHKIIYQNGDKTMFYSVNDKTGEIIALYENIAVKFFSFVSDSQYYKDGEPGVKTNGFKNIKETKISNKDEAIELAKKEVTIDYNEIIICYDENALMWRVDFSTKDMVGGCQSVYFSINGITKLIVYGE